jgi:pectinesterase
MGSGFIGRDMTIRNTAGAVGQQAVALRASGDQQAFANMNLEGYQVSYQVNIL